VHGSRRVRVGWRTCERLRGAQGLITASDDSASGASSGNCAFSAVHGWIIIIHLRGVSSLWLLLLLSADRSNTHAGEDGTRVTRRIGGLERPLTHEFVTTNTVGGSQSRCDHDPIGIVT
jgi:hypothetical protein